MVKSVDQKKQKNDDRDADDVWKGSAGTFWREITCRRYGFQTCKRLLA
jgi:hypothetical protein